MTEIFVIDYDDFKEKYGGMDFPNDYFNDLKHEGAEKLCEEYIAECMSPIEFEQRFNDGEYSDRGYFVRIFEFEEED